MYICELLGGKLADEQLAGIMVNPTSDISNTRETAYALSALRREIRDC